MRPSYDDGEDDNPQTDVDPVDDPGGFCEEVNRICKAHGVEMNAMYHHPKQNMVQVLVRDGETGKLQAALSERFPSLNMEVKRRQF